MMRVAEKGYATKSLTEQIILIWEQHVSPDVRCNIWHIQGRERDLLIDAYRVSKGQTPG